MVTATHVYAECPFDDLIGRAYLEFNEVSDYIWKSPKLIEYETKLELQKMAAYFPNELELRKKRSQMELPKLQHTFPYLVAVGNLFNAMSLFESYLLLLAAELQISTGSSVRDERGQGLSKLLNYLRSVGLAPERITLYEQVQAATRIRNCFMHSSGMLSWSRDHLEIRRLQSSGSYLSHEHRKMRRANKGTFDELSVSSSMLGDRLTVNNKYAWVLCGYLRDYFIALCTEAKCIFHPELNK